MVVTLLTVAPLALPPFWQRFLTEILIWGLLAMSSDVLIGYTGMISFGHSAYFGVGAYAVAFIVKYAKLESAREILIARARAIVEIEILAAREIVEIVEMVKEKLERIEATKGHRDLVNKKASVRKKDKLVKIGLVNKNHMMIEEKIEEKVCFGLK